MSEVLNLVDLIRSTQAEIARVESAAATHGMDLGLELALASMQRRLDELEHQFANATAASEIDVCSYRLQNESSRRYPVGAIGRTFVTFQNWFSVLYDVAKRGEPRKRANLSPESSQESAFDFGYAFAGSLGFVFTLQNEKPLLGDSLLDMAMSALMEFPRAESTAQISELAKKYGLAPVRLAYQWARAHADAGLNVDLKWQRKGEVRLELIAQLPDLKRLADLIASTSEFTVDTFDVYGELVGIDSVSQEFRIVADSKHEIKGRWHSSFVEPKPVTLHTYYTAKVEIHTRVHYATDAEDKTYLLMALVPGAHGRPGLLEKPAGTDQLDIWTPSSGDDE